VDWWEVLLLNSSAAEKSQRMVEVVEEEDQPVLLGSSLEVCLVGASRMARLVVNRVAMRRQEV